MVKQLVLRFVGVCAVALCAAGSPALGQRTVLSMLDQIDSGRWELRLRDSSNNTQRLCVSSGRRFIQLRHPETNCERLVVEDNPYEVTVQYTCRGKGYGRTHIRRESNRLVQIESQGIANGLPFEFSAEARRVGDCSA